IRHPFDYLRSTMTNQGRDPDEGNVLYELRQWVAMVTHARRWRDTGRYFEFRMEDFDAQLPRLLDFLALAPDPACIAASTLLYVPSARRPGAAERRPIAVTAGMIEHVDG